MSKEQVRILIVGDELGLGQPMAEAFTAAGFKVDHASRSSDANTFMDQSSYDYAFVDCMLGGGGTGVDFIVKAREHSSKTKYILMSGVFTDKAFVKEALDLTKAVTFIEKKTPFDMQQVLQLVDNSRPDAEMAYVRKKLYQTFGNEKVSNRDKRKLIESLEEVSGFDLPFIYSLLVETMSSGYLNIYGKDGAVSGISISRGEIVGVDVEDKTTYLGEMLIQTGYVLPDDLTSTLSERTDQKLGLRLIKNNQLSPHAFDLILTEQMNIRLSRTIGDQRIRINFAATDVEPSQPSIDSERLRGFLHDWIASKLSQTWLKALYMNWGGHKIEFSPSFNQSDAALSMGLVKALPGIIDKIKIGSTLNQLIMQRQYTETALLKGLHFLLTRGLIVFGSKAGFRDATEQYASLQHLQKDIEGKDAYELVMALGLESPDDEAISSIIGPEPKEPATLVVLWKELKSKIDKATSQTQDVSLRIKAKQDAAAAEAEIKLQVTAVIEEAKTALGLNQYVKALQLLMSAQAALPTASNLHLLLSWARLGTMNTSKKFAQLKDVEMDLLQIPAEERYDATYPFVMGLFAKAKGDITGARKQFEKAIALNPSMLAARREISSLANAKAKNDNKDVLNMDLKTFIGGIFTGKKK